MLTYKGAVYCKKNLKKPDESLITDRLVEMPVLKGCLIKKDPKLKTLIFDLDETLVHSVQLKTDLVSMDLLKNFDEILTIEEGTNNEKKVLKFI